jgi:hypothetical protein
VSLALGDPVLRPVSSGRRLSMSEAASDAAGAQRQGALEHSVRSALLSTKAAGEPNRFLASGASSVYIGIHTLDNSARC